MVILKKLNQQKIHVMYIANNKFSCGSWKFWSKIFTNKYKVHTVYDIEIITLFVILLADLIGFEQNILFLSVFFNK